MATKTFKIGEYCAGGIITAETTKTKAIVIQKQWDFSQGTRRSSNQKNAEELNRIEVNLNDENAKRKLQNFLWDITTSYYTDKVIEWFESKVKFNNSLFW